MTSASTAAAISGSAADSGRAKRLVGIEEDFTTGFVILSEAKDPYYSAKKMLVLCRNAGQRQHTIGIIGALLCETCTLPYYSQSPSYSSYSPPTIRPYAPNQQFAQKWARSTAPAKNSSSRATRPPAK